MAAITNNARAIAGIAGGWGDGTTASAGNGSKIVCLRIGWDSFLGGFVRMDWAAQALNYVTDMKNRGVNVAAVNASWGSSNSGGLNEAVDNLLAADVMLIHAAGNSNSNSPDFLGSKAGVMNVAATDKNGNKASFSNYGSWVDIAAPGVDIISTYHNKSDPANDYVAVMDGTSMAAPHAAGVAGLLESCDAGLSGPEKLSIMVDNTCLAGSPNIGGILNAKLAFDAVPGGCGGCTSDADCDDGDACNGVETCDIPTGTCQPGTPVDCDDGDVCTTDSCDPATGVCLNDPISCDDGDPCTIDSCDPATGCVNAPINCDDYDACTTDSCDPATGLCVNDPLSCDDGDPCTIDSCDPATGCANAPIDCDDYDACTTDSCDPATGLCVNDPINCDDGDPCTTDSCDPISGCVNDPVVPAVCGDGCCDSAAGEDQCSCPGDCGDPPSAETLCTDGIDNDCDGLTDGDDPDCVCLPKGASCTDDSECCSNKCKGKSGSKTCKGG